jgi:hypothetical protein
MKPLNNYITERIRVDNIKHLEFPIDGTIDDMVKFLKAYNFEECDTKNKKYSSKVFLNDMKAKSYVISFDYTRIWFADTSKNEISKINPMFFISLKSSTIGEIYEIMYGDGTDLKINKNAFVRELKRHFGF